ncbi:MAG: three-Cys-motif partner protein TcmP [Phycisphaerales bacterium JB050]
MRIEPIDDGLVIPEVGQWSKRKYHFLERYLDLFTTGMKRKWPQRHYIDLFAGAGFSKLKDSGEIVCGSPLLAANVTDPFTHIHAFEVDRERASALSARLGVLPEERQTVTCCEASDAVPILAKRIPRRGALCLTFIDPYGLHIDFATIAALTSGINTDLIVLMADNMDALRNWAKYYINNPDSNLDRFMGEPGWRSLLEASPSDSKAERLRDAYLAKLGTELGFVHTDSVRVQNSQGRDIYTLLYASRSPKGLEFWSKAKAVDESGQRSLFS